MVLKNLLRMLRISKLSDCRTFATFLRFWSVVGGGFRLVGSWGPDRRWVFFNWHWKSKILEIKSMTLFSKRRIVNLSSKNLTAVTLRTCSHQKKLDRSHTGTDRPSVYAGTLVIDSLSMPVWVG